VSIQFLGQRFTPGAFRGYLAEVGERPNKQWWGRYPVLHHTAVPSLAQRPNGLTNQHLQNLLDYYQHELKWSGAPHLFVDDKPDGIIVFQRLDRRGVHAASFNADGWGIEMLGDYDTESPTTGRGRLVLQNAAHALAAFLDITGGKLADIKFHREDPKTTKTCPGKLITRELVTTLVGGIGEPAPLPPALQQPAPTLQQPAPAVPAPWAAESWGWAETEGLLKGNPTGTLTRQELAVILHRYHQKGTNNAA